MSDVIVKALTAFLYILCLLFLSNKGPLGQISTPSCNHFTMLSHPLNGLCLKDIRELDCGNWGLSRPNGHRDVSPPFNTIFAPFSPLGLKSVPPPVLPCRPGIQFNGLIPADVMPVITPEPTRGGSTRRASLPLLQVHVGGAIFFCGQMMA